MGLSQFNFETMIPGAASSAVIRTMFKTEDGVIFCYGTSDVSVLEAEADVYAPGCIYIKSLTAGSSIVYVNEGTAASPDFDAITTA